MIKDLNDAVTEIFQYKRLLQDVITASFNVPEVFLDKIFPIYEDFVELVESFEKFTLDEVKIFINETLIGYSKQPFFPVLAGLFITALINKLFQDIDNIYLDLQELCYGIVDDAKLDATYDSEDDNPTEVNFSLDFIGYLLPKRKTLTIKGPVGDYCGCLMEEGSTLILNGFHGKNFGYEKDESAKIIFNKQ